MPMQRVRSNEIFVRVTVRPSPPGSLFLIVISKDVADLLCFCQYDLESIVKVCGCCLGILFCPVSNESKSSRSAKPKGT
jgi:hypothetical protein